jgi:hypothetical protein
MERTLRQYDAAAAECLALFEQKAHDYGTAWRVLRVPSLTDQLFIKAQRIRTLQEKGGSKVGEGIRPELIGIVNYAAMALVQWILAWWMTPDLDAEKARKKVQAKIQAARELMTRKNHDYGEAWREMRIGSLVDLILMKLLRIKQIEDKGGNTLVSEGIDANFLDIINYAVFGLILMGGGCPIHFIVSCVFPWNRIEEVTLSAVFLVVAALFSSFACDTNSINSSDGPLSQEQIQKHYEERNKDEVGRKGRRCKP